MVSKGSEVYRCDCFPCKGCGISWSQEELDAAIQSDVVSLVYDTDGVSACLEMFLAGATTQFDMTELLSIFERQGNLTDWQVGEYIATAYLASCRGCFFPWNSARDIKTPNCSLPGADICGICNVDGTYRFFFGEVKTSHENKYPPQVVSQRKNSDGLAAQIEILRDDIGIQKTLITYLAHRVVSTPWQDCFKEATIRYSKNRDDITIFGFLVRDVEPNPKDIKKRVSDVAKNSRPQSDIEFVALYLPDMSISNLAVTVVTAHQGKTY